MPQYNLYDYKERGEVIRTIRALTLAQADVEFQKQVGRDPETMGLHIRQCPEELAKLTKR